MLKAEQVHVEMLHWYWLTLLWFEDLTQDASAKQLQRHTRMLWSHVAQTRDSRCTDHSDGPNRSPTNTHFLSRFVTPTCIISMQIFYPHRGPRPWPLVTAVGYLAAVIYRPQPRQRKHDEQCSQWVFSTFLQTGPPSPSTLPPGSSPTSHSGAKCNGLLLNTCKTKEVMVDFGPRKAQLGTSSGGGSWGWHHWGGSKLQVSGGPCG